ncbi:PREDICTED: protein FAM50A-like isoform X2 [Acropora digitifera]|uniref:protein FAM50A-like isoform X2 n=1 Tax=Acropora digitifera TaxID=70779 RepID=UPI00077A3063|nr:PREDICTED: protein FAM50A-like isoform X2 [Acropora digitifera]
MATTEKLQNEILLKEEAFLKEAKAKLTEQLKKLKSSSSSQRTNDFETETAAVNHIPLSALNSSLMNKDTDVGEEEEDDKDDDDEMEDDETEYSQQLMNAMSNLHQSNDVDANISRSVFRSVLQQELDDLDEEDGFWE